MFGHEWEPARGTIVESRIEQTTVAGEPGLHQVRVYVVDVRKPHGAPLRATVQSPHGASTELAPGMTVRLEINSRAGEVRFDPGPPAGSVGFSSPDAPSTFVPATPVTPATPAATFSSPADSFGRPTSSVGPPGGSVSFSSPAVAPPAFEPVAPVTPFSAGDQDSESGRIARLEDQRDRGQLTQQQFEAQRQQIMDEI
ncbi:MAG TPA: hypothetical protein VMV07_25335 [Streptosporangiaceae bacterium]|nr:hypothetical protein [Streptosporangiaceae bacterium]